MSKRMMVCGITVPPELFEPPKFGDLRQINAVKRFEARVKERLEGDLYEANVYFEATDTVRFFAKESDDIEGLAVDKLDFHSAFVDHSEIKSIRKLPHPYRPGPLPPEVQPRLFDEAS